MNLSFVVCTAGEDWDRVARAVRSFCCAVPENKREIILVGTQDVYLTSISDIIDNVRWIPFDEGDGPGRICEKKNLGIQAASHDVVVVSHDYYSFESGFYEGLCRYDSENPDWDLMMVKITNNRGERYHDHCCWDDKRSAPGKFWRQTEFWNEPGGRLTWGRPAMIPYDETTPYWYIPGGFWIAKRKFMLDNPLPKHIRWGSGEDVYWSLSIREFAKYVMNAYSSVTTLKYKPACLPEISLK